MEWKERLMGSDLTKSLLCASSLFLWKLLSEVFKVPQRVVQRAPTWDLQNPMPDRVHNTFVLIYFSYNFQSIFSL